MENYVEKWESGGNLRWEKMWKTVGERERGIWGEKRGILRCLFCSQSQKRLPIGGEGKMGRAYGFFHPYHPKKYIFFGVVL